MRKGKDRVCDECCIVWGTMEEKVGVYKIDIVTTWEEKEWGNGSVEEGIVSCDVDMLGKGVWIFGGGQGIWEKNENRIREGQMEEYGKGVR